MWKKIVSSQPFFFFLPVGARAISCIARLLSTYERFAIQTIIYVTLRFTQILIAVPVQARDDAGPENGGAPNDVNGEYSSVLFDDPLP